LIDAGIGNDEAVPRLDDQHARARADDFDSF
jgi:hypothetical protein